jgi:hypothetical protein
VYYDAPEPMFVEEPEPVQYAAILAAPAPQTRFPTVQPAEPASVSVPAVPVPTLAQFQYMEPFRNVGSALVAPASTVAPPQPAYMAAFPDGPRPPPQNVQPTAMQAPLPKAKAVVPPSRTLRSRPPPAGFLAPSAALPEPNAAKRSPPAHVRHPLTKPGVRPVLKRRGPPPPPPCEFPDELSIALQALLFGCREVAVVFPARLSARHLKRLYKEVTDSSSRDIETPKGLLLKSPGKGKGVTRSSSGVGPALLLQRRESKQLEEARKRKLQSDSSSRSSETGDSEDDQVWSELVDRPEDQFHRYATPDTDEEDHAKKAAKPASGGTTNRRRGVGPAAVQEAILKPWRKPVLERCLVDPLLPNSTKAVLNSQDRSIDLYAPFEPPPPRPTNFEALARSMKFNFEEMDLAEPTKLGVTRTKPPANLRGPEPAEWVAEKAEMLAHLALENQAGA